MTTPRCGLLFHFTHLDNLPAVLEQGALLSDTTVCRLGLLATEAGDPEIKYRRRQRQVTAGRGGVVADYVPFYFAARSPMMFKLWKGGVPSFTGDIRDLVYLVTDIQRILATGAAFVFSDRNAATSLAAFADDITLLGDLSLNRPESDFIDWPLMRAQMWQRTDDDPARMERRMAEFLVHDRAPLALLGIAVHGKKQAGIIEQVFGSKGLEVKVALKPEWYYQ